MERSTTSEDGDQDKDGDQDEPAQAAEGECRFGSDEWVIQERARRRMEDSMPAKRPRTLAEQGMLDWEMGREEAVEDEPQESHSQEDVMEGFSTDSEDSEEPVEPVCKRSVASVDLMPCRCPVCCEAADAAAAAVTAAAAVEVRRVQDIVHAPVETPVQQKIMCTKCGHDTEDMLCCQNKRTYAQVVASGRTGERQRQEQSKRRKEQHRLEEEALLRPRIIPSLDQAQSSAQSAMARIRERMLARTGK